MKHTLPILFIILIIRFYSIELRASNDYTGVDQFSINAPGNFKSTEMATAYLTGNKSYSEFEKIRSIFVWITDNIKFDLSSYLNHVKASAKPSYILKEKKALSEGYAVLFKKMCDESGIEAYVINGYLKGFDHDAGTRFIHSNHSWNAVRLGNHWYIVDLTLGCGYLEKKEKMFAKIFSGIIGMPSIKNKVVFKKSFNEKYFCATPENMIYSHLPEDPAWQFLDHPVPLKIFERDSLAISKYISNGHHKHHRMKYSDIMNNFHSMHDTTILMSSARRAYLFNHRNNLVMCHAHIKSAELVIDETTHIVKESKKLLEEKYKEAIFHLEKAASFISLDADTTKNQYRDDYEETKELYRNRKKELKSQIKRNEKLIADNDKFIDGISKKKKYIYKKIKRYNKENINLSFDDRIFDVRRPDELPDANDSIEIDNNISVFFQNKDTISQIQKGIDSIYRIGYKGLYDTIKDYRFTLIDKINNNIHLIDVNLDLLKEFEKDLHPNIDQNKKLIAGNNHFSDLMREDIENKEKRGFKDKYYLINDKIRFIKGLVKENKKLLKTIKKLSFIDQDEDERYLRENDNLMEENYLIIAQFFEEFEFTKSEIPILKQENKLLKQEIKLLKREYKTEDLLYETEVSRVKEKYAANKSENKKLSKHIRSLKSDCERKMRRL